MGNGPVVIRRQLKRRYVIAFFEKLAPCLSPALPTRGHSDLGETSRPGLGWVPKQSSSGGKPRLAGISKQGDRYRRGLFTAGALAVIRYVKIHGIGHRPWLTALLAQRPTKVAAIALANKIARMAWAMMPGRTL